MSESDNNHTDHDIAAMQHQIEILTQTVARLVDATDPRKLTPLVEYAPGCWGSHDFRGWMMAMANTGGWYLYAPGTPVHTFVEQGPETGTEGLAKLRAAVLRHGYTWRTA